MCLQKFSHNRQTDSAARLVHISSRIRFKETDTTRNMDKTGSGIGLAIVREFLQAHGETITVKSEKGKGAAFVFSLKLAKKEN